MKSFCKSLKGLFPCFKGDNQVLDTEEQTYLNEFIQQLQQDKNEHLMKKVDIDMISMELNNVMKIFEDHSLIVQRWKHYLRCQMRLLADEDIEWAEIVNDWLEEEKFFKNSTFYQNEMIYADFFSGCEYFNLQTPH